MPFTPYHFGPSGFLALALRKWLDMPVFVLANIVVDIEVLIIHRLPIHRYCHTLLIGAAVGALWGLLAYPLRNCFKKIMNIIRIPYQTGFWKMLFSGVLGVWLHVIIDAIYHGDVRIFFPSNAKPLWRLLTGEQIKIACAVLFIAALMLYAFTLVSYKKQNNPESRKKDLSQQPSAV